MEHIFSLRRQKELVTLMERILARRWRWEGSQKAAVLTFLTNMWSHCSSSNMYVRQLRYYKRSTVQNDLNYANIGP